MRKSPLVSSWNGCFLLFVRQTRACDFLEFPGAERKGAARGHLDAILCPRLSKLLFPVASPQPLWALSPSPFNGKNTQTYPNPTSPC